MMKAGDEVKCPHCGASSFLVKKPVMEGWTKRGDLLACASCGGKVADLAAPAVEAEAKGDGSKQLDKLASFLGTSKVEHKTLKADEKELRFCRDCQHFIAHPFLNRCDLRDRNVNPMDDCGQFTPKK